MHDGDDINAAVKWLLPLQMYNNIFCGDNKFIIIIIIKVNRRQNGKSNWFITNNSR